MQPGAAEDHTLAVQQPRVPGAPARHPDPALQLQDDGQAPAGGGGGHHYWQPAMPQELQSAPRNEVQRPTPHGHWQWKASERSDSWNRRPRGVLRAERTCELPAATEGFRAVRIGDIAAGGQWLQERLAREFPEARALQISPPDDRTGLAWAYVQVPTGQAFDFCEAVLQWSALRSDGQTHYCSVRPWYADPPPHPGSSMHGRHHAGGRGSVGRY